MTMFSGLIAEREQDRKVFSIKPTIPGPEIREVQRRLITEQMSASLTYHLDDLRDSAEETPPLDPERTFAGFDTPQQLKSHVRELLRNQLDFIQLGGVTFPWFYGDLIYGLPYHEDWHGGGGISAGGTQDGHVITYGERGFSGAGLGLYFSSDIAVAAAITPIGTYSFSWAAFEDLPTLHTRGGLSTSVYLGTQQVMFREAVLWSQSGATVLGGQSGQGEIAGAASPPTGFGPVTLGPVYLDMAPETTYIFWVSTWQVAEYPENASFIGTISMHMPMVKIRQSPPTVVH